MPTLESIMETLQSKGSETYRKTYARHGVPLDRTFGVSNAHLKVIAKSIKGQQALACELYATGNMDAMYLAGLVADGAQLTPKQLQAWADQAAGLNMISDHIVPWLTVEHPSAHALALAWIDSKKPHIASVGWRTLAGLVATRPDDTLDLPELERLLATVAARIHQAPNRVRSNMNGFVIAVGTYVKPLLPLARRTAQQIGPVSVDMGDTACKVSSALESFAKAEAAGKLGQKRKTIRC